MFTDKVIMDKANVKFPFLLSGKAGVHGEAFIGNKEATFPLYISV